MTDLACRHQLESWLAIAGNGGPDAKYMPMLFLLDGISASPPSLRFAALLLAATYGRRRSYKKQLIAPWAQSLVPETCRGAAVLERLGEDSVRRAKADFPLVPLCPVKSMAPVLAIAGMVARAVDTTAL